MFVLLSLTTNSLYCFTNSKNFFLFFANLLKKPVSSAGDICLPLRGSFNLWKKWSLSFPNSISSGDNCWSAYFSTWSKSDLAISAISVKSSIDSSELSLPHLWHVYGCSPPSDFSHSHPQFEHSIVSELISSSISSYPLIPLFFNFLLTLATSSAFGAPFMNPPGNDKPTPAPPPSPISSNAAI